MVFETEIFIYFLDRPTFLFSFILVFYHNLLYAALFRFVNQNNF